MNTSLWKTMLLNVAQEFAQNVTYLCEIDGKTGDGDHGVTIGKIGEAIRARCSKFVPEDTIKQVNDDLSMSLMDVNGGSAGPLYGTLFEGFADGVDASFELTMDEIKRMFLNGKDEFYSISKAEKGDKTMADALYPAIEAIQESHGDTKELFYNAYEAAETGAQSTKDMIAKFGRAKNMGDRCIGHLDPGAVSMSLFFKGLFEALE